MRVLIQDLPDRPHANAGQVLDLPAAEAMDMLRRGSAVLAPEPAPKPSTAVKPAQADATDRDTPPARTTRRKKR